MKGAVGRPSKGQRMLRNPFDFRLGKRTLMKRT